MEQVTARVQQVRNLLHDRRGVRLAQEVRRRRLTYLSTEALLDLRQAVAHAERAGVPGTVVEAGCALGGSTILLASGKSPDRRMAVYDVFGTIPPPSERDGDDVHERYAEIAAGKAQGIQGDAYYGYEQGLKDKVSQTLANFGFPCEKNAIDLIEGLFEDTMNPDWPVAVAHVDGDWYDSVTVCLERLWPRLSSGGVIIIDDYDAWTGCRRAVDDFLSRTDDYMVKRRTRLQLVKR
jgi:hypothetical protein